LATDSIRRIPIAEVVEDPKNARRRDERATNTLASSLGRFGAARSIVLDADGVVRAGNGTVEAARAAGIEEVLVVETNGRQLVAVKRPDWSDAEAMAYALADNRTAELASWDSEALAASLGELASEYGREGFEPMLESVGFSELELGELIDVQAHQRGSPEVEQDHVPQLPANPVTKQGDAWELGRHRLVCGDCRDEHDVAKLVGDSKITVAVTSPPYAQQRKYDESSGFTPIPPDEYVDWFEAVQSNIANILAEDGSWFLNIKEHCEDGQRVLYVKDLTLAHVRRWGWQFVDEFAWTHGGTPKAVVRRFKNGWEPIFQFTRAMHKFRPDSVMHETKATAPDWGGKHPSQNDGRGLQVGSNADLQGSSVGGRAIHDAVAAQSDGFAYPSNSLSLGKNREALGHGAAYPVSLPAFFIKAYSDEGDNVFDPFMGSGTTLIAAEQLNRAAFGTELSPGYCDIVVDRWQNLTGGKARRSAT